MKVNVEAKDISNKITDMAVVGVFEGQHLDGSLIELDKKLDGAISEVIMTKEFEGKYGQHALIHSGRKISPKRVMIIGLGKKDALNLTRLGHIAGRVAKHARVMGFKDFSTVIYGITDKISLDDAAHTITEWSIMGQYKYDEMKTEDERRGKEVEFLTILTEKGKDFKIAETIKGPVIEAHAANYARSIANIPANIASSEFVAKKAKELAKDLKIDCKVYEMEELKKMKMNALVGVGQGAEHGPKLVVLDYNPKGAKRTIAVIGKTIIFDSGGISLKPSLNMGDMKFDKSGGCMVLGIMKSVAEQRIATRVIGILTIAENLPSGSAQRPGDIVVSAQGKTIEVANTDAEGRLVLCDGIHHALGFKPNMIIDLATLTGAVGVALGKYCAGMFGNNDKMNAIMKKASELSTERVWELPTWDDYYEIIKSEVADIKNIGPTTGEAGAIAGAMFLKKFVGTTPWIHLDIASTAYDEDRPHHFKGSTGFGVRLVTEFLNLLEKEN